MQFIGFVVNGKPFGAGQYKEAKEYAEKVGSEVKTWRYKV